MFEKLKNYAARQLELDASEITPDSTFESLGIDSLDVVEMIMDLETELAWSWKWKIRRSPPSRNWPISSSPS